MKKTNKAQTANKHHQVNRKGNYYVSLQTTKSIASKIIDADALQAERFSIKPRACEAIIEVA